MMRARLSFGLMLMTLTTAAVSAHVIVSPPESKASVTQKYEVRVHNEGTIAATSVEVEIPDGVTVTTISKPDAGTYTTKKAGDRITSITWQVEVAPSKYVALPFSAKNPDVATELHWTVHEHLADGTVVNWSDKPGSQEAGSVTKLTAGKE